MNLATIDWSERNDARGRLIVCRITDPAGVTHEGSARIFARGEEDARARAQAQAEEKLRANAGA